MINNAVIVIKRYGLNCPDPPNNDAIVLTKRKQKFAGSFARVDSILCELVVVISDWLVLLLLLLMDSILCELVVVISDWLVLLLLLLFFSCVVAVFIIVLLFGLFFGCLHDE